jgi:hypothetical protein
VHLPISVHHCDQVRAQREGVAVAGLGCRANASIDFVAEPHESSPPQFAELIPGVIGACVIDGYDEIDITRNSRDRAGDVIPLIMHRHYDRYGLALIHPD